MELINARETLLLLLKRATGEYCYAIPVPHGAPSALCTAVCQGPRAGPKRQGAPWTAFILARHGKPT